MGLKSIFREGLKERKRRKSLGGLNREFKDKEKNHAELLTALGQQAWERRTDINAFADIRSALVDTQKGLDDLRVQAEQLQKQKQGLEERKKQENERLAAAQREKEEKKRDTDKRLNEQKNILQSGQKEAQRAKGRMAAIAGERVQLQNKAAVSTITETEKSEIARNLSILAKEEEALQAGIGCRDTADKPVAALAAALQEDSVQLQKQIDGLRQELKQVTSDLDKKIAAVQGDLAKNSEKTRESTGRLKDNFKQLGGKLVAAGAADPVLAKEMAAVLKSRTEMEGIQALIGGLDRQKDDGQVGAYRKMMAIIIGAIVVLVAVIVVLLFLFGPKKKEAPFAAMFGEKGSAVQDLQELSQQMQKGLGGIKAASEKIQGQPILIAGEETLKSILPSNGGWQMQNPSYQQGKYGELETASLTTDMSAEDGRSVRVEITDAGSASALLAPVKMLLAMNISQDDENEYRKVSVYNDMPVLESYDKNSRETSFGIIAKERYLIKLTTDAADGLALLKGFMGKFDFKRLP